MINIEIYTKPHCPYCHRAKALLDRNGLDYQEIDISNNAHKQAEMMQRSQRATVPQIFVNDQHIGGSDDLVAADLDGTLDSITAPVKQNSSCSNVPLEIR